MNNEIWFVFDGKKIVLDSDPFEKHNGYFYLPDGRIGHANNMTELSNGKITVKNSFDCPQSKQVRAFTVKMQDFDVEFDNGLPIRFWIEKKNNQTKKMFSEDELKRLQRAAQKLCDNCKFGEPKFGITVAAFVVANKNEPFVCVAECIDNFKQWKDSPR